MATLRASFVTALITCAGAALGQNTGAAPEQVTPGAAVGGQSPLQEQARANARPGPDVSVALFGTHTFEADFSDGPGSVSVTRGGAEVSIRQPIDDRSRLSLSIGAELSSYDFSTPSPFSPSASKPWDETANVGVTAIYSRQATQQWSWYFGGGAESSLENEANLGKSFIGGLVAGANYAVSDKLSLGGGVIARSRLEDSGLFFPIVSIDWKISDQWRLSNSNEINSTGVALTYTPCEQWEFSLRGAYAARAFRLDEDGPFPDGVGRDARIPVWVQARWNFNKRASASLAAGYTVWQEYTIDDNNGVELGQQDADPAPFVGLGFVLLF